MRVRCGVVGDPVAHSLSPMLHAAAYVEVGLAGWTYDAVRVPERGLAAFLAELDPSWRGLSVTMPLKREALAAALRSTDRARLAGGANTLLLEAGRVVLADNTDLPGASAAVRERYDGPVTAGTVLGGGATAASTGLALCDLGARRVTLLARTPERAGDAAAAVAAHPSAPQVEVGSLEEGRVTGEVVVSTVPASAQSPDLLARCEAVPVLFEVVYDPWPTPLAAAAGDRVLVTGLDLLVHQAALQLELFTGARAPLSTMRRAGIHALEARRRAG